MALKPNQWATVRTMARTLAIDVDRNELGKAVAFLRLNRHKCKFLTLLERLPHSDYLRTGKTKGYFEQMRQTCRRYLTDVSDEDAVTMLAWAFRLMAYYAAKDQPLGPISRGVGAGRAVSGVAPGKGRPSGGRYG